ncbi:MAG TPA: translocation/assembly module TamB domain-containing protein, partial [Polyangiales bacterium]|nr:translocation/assembly module TamB domain-containing protein [Polyangiales bacterium]
QRVTYTGYVALHDGELYPIATGQQLTNISASLTGKEGWIKIDSLGAKAGDGTLSAQGGIGFERWSPKRIQLALLMRKFPIKREAVDLAWLTGSAALSTDIGEEKATTAVKLHSLAVSLPEASSRSLQPLEPHPDVSLTTEAREHPDIPYSLEFFVDGRVPITVKRNDFDATIRTELAMSYQDPDFRVGGYVEFQRGTFEVFGKEFVLNRGTMHFDGTGELNPEVNMVATHEPDGTGGSAVVVNVTGTLAEPHVEFQSDSCPGDGAVVMLVSGRCPNEDPNSGGSAQDAQDAFAAGVIGGILTLGAKRELGALIPRISVESTGQGAQTRLKAGFEAVPKFMRSFVQRVYLQGAVSTGDQGTSSTTDPAQNPNGDVASALDFLIELYFPHNIVGSGKFSPERFWGLDVTWEP